MTAGLPAIFVRLTGCDLRCTWCDTRYAGEGGKDIDIEEIVHLVSGFKIPRVVITGGEPLIQGETLELISKLADNDYKVFLETSGAHDIGEVDKRATVRLDFKPPSSGMTEKMRWDNVGKLKSSDETKIAIADETDYKWACEIMGKYDLTSICPVNFTPVTESIDPALLAKWIVSDALNVRLNIQLHKIIWGVEAEGV